MSQIRIFLETHKGVLTNIYTDGDIASMSQVDLRVMEQELGYKTTVYVNVVTKEILDQILLRQLK